MDISMFEVVGPVMIGPSSSLTAGMARIGATARRFLQEPVKSIDLKMVPRKIDSYAGNRTHLALIGGVLGLSEYDPRIKDALTLAKEQGIALTVSVFSDPIPSHPLTVKLTMGLRSGAVCSVTGVSIGGGSIEIIGVDQFDVKLSGTEAYLFIWADEAISGRLESAFPGAKIEVDQKGDQYLYYISIPVKTAKEAREKAEKLAGVKRVLYTDPIIPLGYVPHTPLFTRYDELVALSEKTGRSVAELAIDYEVNRSGRTREEIRKQMAQQLAVMKTAKEDGLTMEIVPLYGFNKGNSGKLLMQAYKEGKTMGGSLLPKAIAIALATMEYSTSMSGCVVAAPTAGSSGIMPGCLLTAQDDRGYTDEQLIDALFVGAAIGAVMYYHHASFSGSHGGCQGEVGVCSAMTAGSLVYLAGGNTRQIVHGAALAMKNIIGLICDPMGCGEVPCIKRNGIGVANAYSGADMAIAGIESYIPADEVIESFVYTQKVMPVEMRGSGCGATGTRTGIASKKTIAEMDESILLPRQKE